jgi:formamidopyrimidine-DNA glycosylase
MPELPEVETVRRSLVARLQGRRILWVDSSETPLRQGVEVGRWRACVGAHLADITRRGKYLIFALGDWAAVLHLGMSGRLLVRPSGAAAGPHTHLRIGFAGGWELHFVDPRRFGVAVLLEARERTTWPPLAQLGVDALHGDLEAALASLAGSRAPIRNALLDQHCIAGLGNIYANEALARAGIRPTLPAGRLSPARRARLAGAIRATLADALAAGGTTLADGGFVDADGEGGYFAVALAVYGREGQPCRRCGRAIRRTVVAGRSAYYCPRCQR